MIARKWGALLPTIFALAACDKSIDPVAGTNNETHTKGTLFQANGKVAVGARVRVFAANQDIGDSLPVTQTQVDLNGQIPLQLKRGYYSLLADDTSRSAVFIDSVFSDGDTVMIPVDTLRPTGTLTGHVRVQPMHSPAIAWVHLMRTNLYANVDSSGSFRLDGAPAGNLDLVAVSHLTEYTPTHKLVRVRSDSSIDVDTISLVYNGLPLAKKVAASYDSATGVVTVTWQDTSFARKANWLVYRSNGSNSAIDSVATSSSGSLSDTIFARLGHPGLHSIFDSIETNLSYWVAAQSKDGTTGPRWEKVDVRAKSPALIRRWGVNWSNPIPVTGFALPEYSRLDTLADALSVSQWVNTTDTTQAYQLRLLNPTGQWTTATLPHIPEMESSPLFWKGRVWLVKGRGSARHFDDTAMGNTTIVRTNIYDSAAILSSADGIAWDSVALELPLDSITSFRLNATATELALIPCYKRKNPVVGQLSQSKGMLVSTSGKGWSVRPRDTLLAGQDSRPFVSHYWTASIIPTGPTSTWTLLNGQWAIPSLTDKTNEAIFYSSEGTTLSGNGNFIALSGGAGKHLAIANPLALDSWQYVSTPEPPKGICFWRGQLVILGKSGLHVASITPNQ
ncbi:MAG: hypothetical protein RL173_3005 [Fibrobacterota bacterium]|jgi:hypothetical protein